MKQTKLVKNKRKPFARKPCSEEKKQKISKALTGRKLSKEHIKKMRKNRMGVPLSEETKRRISEAKKGKKCPWVKPPLQVKGEKNQNWKGGICPENKKIRSSIEFKLWRETVFARDDWTCQSCKKRGVSLHAHHISSFAEYPELRTSIENGITLCCYCHLKTGLHRKAG